MVRPLCRRVAIQGALASLVLLAASGYAWFAISRLNNQLESTIAMQNHVEAAADQSRDAVVLIAELA